MMTKKQWLMVLCLFCVYLLLGAAIFQYIESREEDKRLYTENEQRQEIGKLLKKFYNHNDTKLLKELSSYCGKPIQFEMPNAQKRWDFLSALFFVITVVSTIGYGNLSPTTMSGRLIMIFYSLIGIPMNGIVMVTLGGYFGKSFTKLYNRWKLARAEKYDSARFGLIGQIILYSVPGFTFFIFLPSLFMVIFEGWDYDVAVYYSFVTLTTIGFGDYVAGVQDTNRFGEIWYLFYKIFLLIWIIGGLGYVVMILGFITQGMQSKKIQNIELAIRENFIKTPRKIRSELRSILHEFLFLKVKPVYKDFIYTPHQLERSQSCPDLSIYRSTDSPSLRKRAMSECQRNIILQRIQSDTDLERIDKELTFKPSDTFMQQKDLLLKVVDALSYRSLESVNNSDSGGFHLFSDREILASEQLGSNWSISNSAGAVPKRKRAFSDVSPPKECKIEIENDNGNTWYGNDAIKKLKQFRARAFSVQSDSKSTAGGLLQRIKNRLRGKDEKLDTEKQNYLDKTAKGRGSLFSSAEENYLKQTSKGRGSTISNYQESVLEQTSLADFIRALSAITISDNSEEPKRQIGTSSLTPPQSVTPSRKRRLPIRSNFDSSRRNSLIPPQTINFNRNRRFSLMPVEENILSHDTSPPPPYSPPGSFDGRRSIRSRNRRFSVRPASIPVNSSISAVQRQVLKRERTDISSDKK